MSLVGWSLGGIYARQVARRAPEAVRLVVTLGSPFRSLAGLRGPGGAADQGERRSGGSGMTHPAPGPGGTTGLCRSRRHRSSAARTGSSRGVRASNPRQAPARDPGGDRQPLRPRGTTRRCSTSWPTAWPRTPRVAAAALPAVWRPLSPPSRRRRHGRPGPGPGTAPGRPGRQRAPDGAAQAPRHLRALTSRRCGRRRRTRSGDPPRRPRSAAGSRRRRSTGSRSRCRRTRPGHRATTTAGSGLSATASPRSVADGAQGVERTVEEQHVPAAPPRLDGAAGDEGVDRGVEVFVGAALPAAARRSATGRGLGVRPGDESAAHRG